MTEAEWLTCADPDVLLNFAVFQLWGTARRNRLVACACARRVWHLLTDDRSRRAIEVAEYFADGAATAADLDAAWTAAVTEDDGGGGELPVELASYTAWAAAWTAAKNDQQAAAEASQYAAEALGWPRDGHWNPDAGDRAGLAERRVQVTLVRDIFGNPFRPVAIDPRWLAADVLALAAGIYEDRAFEHLPILADALMDAGCDNEEVLSHCRSDAPHVRGCWVVDLLLDKR